MKFIKGIHHKNRPISKRRITFAQKKVDKDIEECGLFPEFIKFNSALEKIKSQDKSNNKYFQRMRDSDAKSWKESRAYIYNLTPEKKEAFLKYWNEYYPAPKSSHYCADLITQIKRGLEDPQTKINKIETLRERGRIKFTSRKAGDYNHLVAHGLSEALRILDKLQEQSGETEQ